MSRRWAVLIGQPVQFSLSPRLHNAAFAAAGIDAHYATREVAPEEVDAAIEALRAPDCLGANVTAPHKAVACKLMDEVSAEARALGAINTVVPRSGRLLGDNTDAQGLAAWLRTADVQVAGQDVVVLGAGGAARATVVALASLGARSARVLNRTPERARALVSDLQRNVGKLHLSWGELEEAATPRAEPVGLLVNATSLGHHGSTPSVDASWYSPRSVAIELVYNPPETDFLRAARAAGARGENGLGMLVHQAALAFERWTGRAAPLDVYWAAARDAQVRA
jgi:shikimate dehydrogenase